MPTKMVETESALDRTLLEEMVVWIKTLKQEGVSADKAAEIAKDFFLAICSGEFEPCCEEEYEEEYDEEQ